MTERDREGRFNRMGKGGMDLTEWDREGGVYRQGEGVGSWREWRGGLDGNREGWSGGIPDYFFGRNCNILLLFSAKNWRKKIINIFFQYFILLKYLSKYFIIIMFWQINIYINNISKLFLLSSFPKVIFKTELKVLKFKNTQKMQHFFRNKVLIWHFRC